MSFEIESFPDTVFSQLRTLTYTGSTLDMLKAYLEDNLYSGSLEDMWFAFLSDNSYTNMTLDEFVAAFIANTILV